MIHRMKNCLLYKNATCLCSASAAFQSFQLGLLLSEFFLVVLLFFLAFCRLCSSQSGFHRASFQFNWFILGLFLWPSSAQLLLLLSGFSLFNISPFILNASFWFCCSFQHFVGLCFSQSGFRRAPFRFECLILGLFLWPSSAQLLLLVFLFCSAFHKAPLILNAFFGARGKWWVHTSSCTQFFCGFVLVSISYCFTLHSVLIRGSAHVAG